MAFKDNLKLAREIKGISKQDMADMLGITYVCYNTYENRGSEPTFNILKSMAKALDVSLDDLLSDDLPLNVFAVENIETQKKEISVEHPNHYKLHANECWDEMIALFGVDEFCIFAKLNAWKYRYRSDGKGKEEDLQKADEYINKVMELKGLK